MASFFYNEAKRLHADGSLDLDTDVIRAALCMTNTTCDIDYETNTVSAFTTLDEFDGTGYTSGHGGAGRQVLSLVITEVVGAPGTGHAKIDAPDEVWSTLAAGTRSIQGVLIHREGPTNDTDAVPVAWSEFAAPQTPSGGNFTCIWDPSGIVRFGI